MNIWPSFGPPVQIIKNAQLFLKSKIYNEGKERFSLAAIQIKLKGKQNILIYTTYQEEMQNLLV